MSHLLQSCLQTYIRKRTRLALYVRSGICLTGRALASDQSTLLFSTNDTNHSQLVYLHAIMTLQEVDSKGLSECENKLLEERLLKHLATNSEAEPSH